MNRNLNRQQIKTIDMTFCLLLVNGENKGTFCEIGVQGTCLIGRDASCNICLNDKVASKTHASITFENGKLMIEDMSSQNGTFVNGKRIALQTLNEGDAITIGMSVFRVANLDSVSGSSISSSSVFSDKQAIDVPVPIHESHFVSNSPKLVECTRKIQDILNKHADNIVKESLKVLFKILPVTRLSIFNVADNNQLTQSYTVMRKSGDKTANMSQSFAQKVLTAGKAVMIEDTSDIGSVDTSASIGFRQVRSIIGVPVVIQGRNRAVLLGDNLEQPDIFTKEHLHIMRFASKVIEVLYQLDAIYKLDNIGNFLPICAQCKKIRDDQGYWNQLESFISERASVKFTHGYCPECAAKVMQEFEIGLDK